MADINVTVSADTTSLQKSFAAANKSFGGFVTAVNQGVELAEKAFGFLESALSGPLEAFKNQELAANKLTLALENQGLEATTLSKKYKEIADALQDKTGIDNDAIVSNLALLQSFVGQTEISKDLANTLVNLGVRLGSTEEAATVLGRAINGDLRGLKQFHISINESGTQAERTAELVKKFGLVVGEAGAAANQGLGGVKGLKAAFDDFLKVIGAEFGPVIGTLIADLTVLAKQLASNPDVKIISADLADVLKNIIQLVKDLVESFGGFKKITNGISDVTDGFRRFFAELGGHKDGPKIVATDATDAARAAAIARVTTAKTTEDGLTVIQTEGEKKRIKALKESADEQQALRKFNDKSLTDNANLLNDILLNNDLEFKSLSAIEQTKFLEAHREELLKSLQTEQEDRDKAAFEKAKKEVDENNKTLEDTRKFGAAYAGIKKLLRSKEVQDANTSFGELTKLQTSNNSTLKAIGKAAAVTQITISTATSAMKIFEGFSSIPFVGVPLGIAGAAAAVAFGAEQIGNVLAAQSGGIVPGINKGFDSVPALLQPGELVVPRNSFSEVISAVADRRSGLTGGSSSTTSSPRGGGQFSAKLEFSGDGAEKFLTARQVEARSLGTLAEAS